MRRRQRKQLSFLVSTGFFHIHITDMAGFCLLCGYLARPEKQGELADWEYDYDDSYGSIRYERMLLRAWGYSYKVISTLLPYPARPIVEGFVK